MPTLDQLNAEIQARATASRMRRLLFTGALLGAGLGGATALGQYLSYSLSPPMELTYDPYVPVNSAKKKKTKDRVKEGAATERESTVQAPSASQPQRSPFGSGMIDSLFYRPAKSWVSNWLPLTALALPVGAIGGYAAVMGINKLYRKWKRNRDIRQAEKEYQRALEQVWNEKEGSADPRTSQLMDDAQRVYQLLTKEAFFSSALSAGQKLLGTGVLIGALGGAYLGYKSRRAASRAKALARVQRQRFEEEKEDMDQPFFYVSEEE